MDGAGDEFLAHAAFAADQDGGVARGGPGDLLGDAAHHRAGADDFALHAQLLAELNVLVLHLRQVLGQVLPLVEVGQGHGHRVGHGQGELEVVRVGHAPRVGRIEVDQPEHRLAVPHRRADHAGGVDFALAVAAAQRAVAHDVSGQHGLALAHHGRGQEMGDGVVLLVGGGPRGDDFEVGAPGIVPRLARQQQQRAGVGLRALEQAGQGEIGHGHQVGGLGQLEGQPAELGGGLAPFRDPAVVFLALDFPRLEKLRLPATMRDRRRLVRGEDAVGVGVHGALGGSVEHGRVVARSVDGGGRLVEGLGQVVDEDELGAADPDDVGRLQRPVALDLLVADHGSVAAFQVAERPLPAGHEDLGVVAAAPIVLDDDLVGRRRGRW